jgi:hypothetical protein
MAVMPDRNPNDFSMSVNRPPILRTKPLTPRNSSGSEFPGSAGIASALTPKPLQRPGKPLTQTGNGGPRRQPARVRSFPGRASSHRRGGSLFGRRQIRRGSATDSD